MTMIKEKFLAYEAVREDGITNMFDIPMVISLAQEYSVELTNEDCLDIMKNYSKYKKEYFK